LSKKYFSSTLLILFLFSLPGLGMELTSDSSPSSTQGASKEKSYPNDLYIRRNLPPLMGQRLFNELLEGSIPSKKKPPTYHVTLIIVKDISPHHGYRLKKRLNKIVNDTFSAATFTPDSAVCLQTEEDFHKVVALLPQENEGHVFMKLNGALVDAVKEYEAQHRLTLQIHPCFQHGGFIPHLTVARSGLVHKQSQRDVLVEFINSRLVKYVESNGKLFELLHLDPTLNVITALPVLAHEEEPTVNPAHSNLSEGGAQSGLATSPHTMTPDVKKLTLKQIEERADQQRAIVARAQKKVLVAQASLKAAQERDLANPASKDKGKAAAKAERKIMLAQRMIKNAEKKIDRLEGGKERE
jgi:2'-5' RNA ligase